MLRGTVRSPPNCHSPQFAAYPRVPHLDSNQAECGGVSLSTPMAVYPVINGEDTHLVDFLKTAVYLIAPI